MSLVGGKLRSNWRLDTTADLGNVLFGGNFLQGSFFPAAAGGIGGASFLGGGLIVGSFASQLSGVGFFQLSALGAISQFYGTGNLGINTSGYKIFPFAFMDFSGDGGSNQIGYALSATQAIASNDSVVVITPKKYAVSGPVTSASNISVHFVYVALIISAPA